MLIHPRQREGLRVLEICYKERVISSAASRTDTWDVDRRPGTKALPKVYVDRSGYSSETKSGGAIPYVYYDPEEENDELKNLINNHGESFSYGSV